MPPALHIGTCSWKYPSWEGLVYSSSKPENFLEEYARTFQSVEIDQWFWSLFGTDKIVLPKADVVEEYRDSVPEHFKFVIKAPNSISLTHLYKQYSGGRLVSNDHFLSPELYDQFLFSLRKLESKIGAISLQFEYLNREKMPSPDAFLDRFLNFIKHANTEIPLCIETRNPNFLTRNYFQLLHENGIGHTFCQGYYMPDIRSVYDKFEPFFDGTQIIRLLGQDRQGIDKKTSKIWNKVVEPKDEEIAGISKMIRRMVDQSGIDLYLNVNNHYEGSAPITIHKMLNHLDGESGPAR